MDKLYGIHFYISIINFDDIILDEEEKTKGVTHAIHALDTFFSCIESYGKKTCKDLVVEKITGARLHMYVTGPIESAFPAVKRVSLYAYQLAGYINTEIPKYKTLLDFRINIGAAFSQFYDFEFTSKEGFSELTSIGYAANYAAKLQALSGEKMFSISENIYDELPDSDQKWFETVFEKSIQKYGQDKYYTAPLNTIFLPEKNPDADLLAARDYANKDDLQDIEFSEVRALLNFNQLSRTKCKKLYGIPVFADVRGYTSKFEDDDSNLEEMKDQTQKILEAMYQISTSYGGVHVQFQGDREFSLYHNIPAQYVNGIKQPEKECYKAAVLAAMRMIDSVKPLKAHIGVGEAFGPLFATKIGARGEKDNILLGKTVLQADTMEDRYADEDQVAITPEVYSGLKNEDDGLSREFTRKGEYYVATIGYSDYTRKESIRQHEINTSKRAYNGAWKDDRQ